MYVRHLFYGARAHIWPVWTGAIPAFPRPRQGASDGSVHRQDRLAVVGRWVLRARWLLRQGRRGASRSECLGGPGRGGARTLRAGRSRTLPGGARRRGSGRPPSRAQGNRRHHRAPSRLRRDPERAQVGVPGDDGGRRRAHRRAVQGYAGTGKTTMLKRLRALGESQGYRTVGLAPSASAAKTLQSESGIHSETLQRYLARHDGIAHGRPRRQGCASSAPPMRRRCWWWTSLPLRPASR